MLRREDEQEQPVDPQPGASPAIKPPKRRPQGETFAPPAGAHPQRPPRPAGQMFGFQPDTATPARARPVLKSEAPEAKPAEGQPVLQTGAPDTYGVAQNFGFGGGMPVLKTGAAAGAPQDFGFSATSATANASSPVGGSTQGYTEQGLNQWLQDPSRYSADVVKQGADVIAASLAKLRKQGQQGIAENAAARGLVGSSVEQQNVLDYEAELQRQGQEQLFNLQREQANTYGADRAASLGAGLAFGDQSINMLGMGMDNDFRWAAMQNDSNFRNMAMSLQAQGMSADDAYRTAALEWQKQYGGAELGIRQQGVNSQYNLAVATMMANAPPGTFTKEQVQAWINSIGGGGGGGSSTSAAYSPSPLEQVASQSIATRNTGAGNPPASQSQVAGNTANSSNPWAPGGALDQWMQEHGYDPANQGSAWPTPGGPLPGGNNGGTSTPPQGGGTQTWAQQGRTFGFSPVNIPGAPNYGLTQEAQRRLGMNQTAPMPNGVTSPVPGGSPGGGFGFPGGGGGGTTPAPGATGTPGAPRGPRPSDPEYTGTTLGGDKVVPDGVGNPLAPMGPIDQSLPPALKDLLGKGGKNAGMEAFANRYNELFPIFGLPQNSVAFKGIYPEENLNLQAINEQLLQKGYLVGVGHHDEDGKRTKGLGLYKAGGGSEPIANSAALKARLQQLGINYK